MPSEYIEGSTGHIELPSTSSFFNVQAASIPISSVQTQDLFNLLTSLKDRSVSFINNPDSTHKQELQQLLNQFYTFLSDYNTFPYESVAYIQFLQLELNTVLQQLPLLNGLPLQEGQVPQLLQQLFSALETFIGQLILDPIIYNQMIPLLTSSMSYTANQPVTAAISLPPEQPQVLLNFFTALEQHTTAFFLNQTPITNQNLQNLFNQWFTFFQDFQVSGYTQYAKFLSSKIINALNEQPLCLGKVSQILQQFYSEMANFIERLIMPEGYYQQLTNLLAQSSSVSVSCNSEFILGSNYLITTMVSQTILPGGSIPFVGNTSQGSNIIHIPNSDEIFLTPNHTYQIILAVSGNTENNQGLVYSIRLNGATIISARSNRTLENGYHSAVGMSVITTLSIPNPSILKVVNQTAGSTTKTDAQLYILMLN
ncbi:hypothetical protein [Bacillus sp. FSL R12-0069]|uniref:hypothetical protein n=1 Tax=Bacillus sp. FSL R12-0069 TaxID=2975342 RepID=UPI0030F66E46